MGWEKSWKKPAVSAGQTLVRQLVSAAREAEKLKGIAVVRKAPSYWAQHFKAMAYLKKLEEELFNLLKE
jgi:hypothetical protein